jgi:hypothetical protein
MHTIYTSAQEVVEAGNRAKGWRMLSVVLDDDGRHRCYVVFWVREDEA